MYLDERRMIPLCMLASNYPEVVSQLEALITRRQCYSYPAHEFFVLMNKPKDMSSLFSKEKALIEALEEGPLSFEAARKRGHYHAKRCNTDGHHASIRRLYRI